MVEVPPPSAPATQRPEWRATVGERPAVTCLICLQAVGAQEMAFMPCIHGPFHFACAKRALEVDTRCPVCRNLVIIIT